MSILSGQPMVAVTGVSNPLHALRQRVQPIVDTILAPWRRTVAAPQQEPVDQNIHVLPSQNDESLARLAVAGSTLGLALIGGAFWSPLRVVTLPLTLGGAFFFYRDSYRAWQGKQSLSSNLIDAIYVTVLVAQGNAIVGSLRVAVSTFSRYLEVQLQAQTTEVQGLAGTEPATQAQALNAQMTLPMFVLSALTWPLLGFTSAVAVLGNMPGYKMRYLGPMTIVNFRYLLAQQQIVLPDARALETLQRVDTLLLDLDAATLTTLPAQEALQALRGQGLTLIWLQNGYEPVHDLALPTGIDRTWPVTTPADKVAVLEQLHKDGQVVCWMGQAGDDGVMGSYADFALCLQEEAGAALAKHASPVTFAQVPLLFARSREFAICYHNNLLIATVLPLVSLFGIYFGHWGVAASTLISTGGMVAGLLNTTFPLFSTQKATTAETV